MTKPTDFVERSTQDFESGVDVATVPANQDPKELLFGKNAPPTEAEPADETFKWDEAKQEFFVEVENNGRMERFSGKTRTEVTKNLIEGKKNANQALAEKSRPVQRTPDTKLPYDPIARKAPRQLTPDEAYRINEIAQTDPIKAQELAFEARTGYDFNAVAESIRLQEETRHKYYAAEVTSDFLAEHQQDFMPSRANMALIDSFLKERKWPVTRNNVEIAFLQLEDKFQKPTPIAVVPPPAVREFTPPPPPVSPPSRPAPAAEARRSGLSNEEVRTINSGSLDDARAVIQRKLKEARGGT